MIIHFRLRLICFKLDLGLAQIYPIWDEDTSDEKTILSASFADPYLIIIRDDLSLLVLQADESGDLDEISFEGEALTNKWVSGSLYEDKHGFFMHLKPTADGNLLGNILLFLLNGEGKLFVSSRTIELPSRPAFRSPVSHTNKSF